jgi:hypothetical protein
VRAEHVDVFLAHEDIVAPREQRAAELRHMRDRMVGTEARERRIGIALEVGEIDVDARRAAHLRFLPGLGRS